MSCRDKERGCRVLSESESLPLGFTFGVALGAVPEFPRRCWIDDARRHRGNDPYRSVITNTSEDGRGTSPKEADATAETQSRRMAQRSDICHHPLTFSSPPRPPQDRQAAGDTPLMTRNSCRIPPRQGFCGEARPYLVPPVGPVRLHHRRVGRG